MGKTKFNKLSQSDLRSGASFCGGFATLPQKSTTQKMPITKALNAMNRICLIFIFGLFSQGVLSGGYHFEVLVESFEKNDGNWDEYTVVLSPTGVEDHWPEEKCESLTIVGEFDSLRWATYKRPMSVEAHKRSISYLSESIGQRVLFGVMGNGLKENMPCLFVSKGLFIEYYSNKRVVLSVHGRI